MEVKESNQTVIDTQYSAANISSLECEALLSSTKIKARSCNCRVELITR